ncbi:MAG: glycerophosphodiester phosphodiesterase [Coriobacteriia bacterium]|nr:glycerophosphodiester phosphodiesterase [Coriobacteriia bacterium]
MRLPWALIALAAALLALVAAYWFATGGMPPRGQMPGWLTRKPIAHRGLHSGDARRPENSIAAFRAAAEAGYPVELDVHLTADGHVVVIHDDSLERMTGDPRRVEDARLEEIRRLRLLGTEERLPTLGEALAEIDGRVPVLVEIKNRGGAGRLEDAVTEELDGYEGEAAVMSFNPFSLARVAERAPDLPRGQLSGTFAGEDVAVHKRFVLRHLLTNWKGRPDFVAYELDGLPRLGVKLQRLRGRPVLAWTAEDPESFERAEALADNVIFDPGALP